MPEKADDGEGTIEIRGKNTFAKLKHPTTGERVRVLLGRALDKVAGRKKLDELLASGRKGNNLAELLDRLLGRRVSARGTKKVMTVRELGEAWTAGKLFEDYGAVAGLGPRASDKIDRWSLIKHCYSVARPDGVPLGAMPVTDVQVADITRTMGVQQGASGTRTHTYQRLKRLFDLAEFPCEIRPHGSNPVRSFHRPRKDPDKTFAWLYPTEVLALLGCREIPLGRRVLYLCASYFGWRKGSLYAFRWAGVDRAHETITVLKQKGRRRLDQALDEGHQGIPIFFAADYALPGQARDTRGVIHVLDRWREYLGRPADDSPVIRLTGVERNHDEAQVLRNDLRAADVTRQMLFMIGKANVEPLRFHDLRATFCTWARRDDRTDNWIAARSGHLPTGQMISRYTRQAVTLSDLRYVPFPDVTSAIPELEPGAVLPSLVPVVPMAKRWWRGK